MPREEVVMASKAKRLARLRLKVFTKTDCIVCQGSRFSPRPPRIGNYCPECGVMSSAVMISSLDFEFLLQLAEENVKRISNS